MKISVASDIHLEFGGLSITNEHKTDVLVLAGDVCVAAYFKSHYQAEENDIRSFFESCCSQWKHVLYVMGNHEHYSGNLLTTGGILEENLNFPNLHILQNAGFGIEDVMFVGTTLWTDYNNNDSYTKNYIYNRMNDYLRIRVGDSLISPDILLAHHEQGKRFIDKTAQLHDNVCVITHHAPSLRSLHSKYKNELTMNRAYCSDLDEFIKGHPSIKTWIHGHVHEKKDYHVDNCRVVCNPRGYIHHEMMAYNFNLIEIEV